MSSPRALPGWLLAAALTLPFWGLGAPLLEVDDARYAQVPAEMLARGDWVKPALNGLPYIEKPPLWYWSAAFSYKAFGVSEAAARLPLALLSLPPPAAATLTSALWAFLSHNMTLDLPLSALLAWTTAFALRGLLRAEDSSWAAPAAWACAALAFLAKGLIALVFPAAWVAALALLRPELRPGARGLLRPAGPLLALAIALPWICALQRKTPDFLTVFFYEQHFQRFATAKYNRGGAWWYYLAALPAGLLPWSVPALSGLWRTLKSPLRAPAGELALALWVLGVAAFFSASHSKLATYVLPVFPALAALAARELERGALPAPARRAAAALAALLAAATAGGAAAALGGLLPERAWPVPGLSLASSRALALLGAALLSSLAAAQAALAAGWSGGRASAALCASGALAWGLALAGLGAAESIASARALGAEVAARARPGDEVWTYGTYLHGLPFYAGRPVDRMVYFVGEFHYAKRDPAFAERFGDDSQVRALPKQGKTVWVALRGFEKGYFTSLPAKGAVASLRDFGRWTLAEVRAPTP